MIRSFSRRRGFYEQDNVRFVVRTAIKRRRRRRRHIYAFSALSCEIRDAKAAAAAIK